MNGYIVGHYCNTARSTRKGDEVTSLRLHSSSKCTSSAVDFITMATALRSMRIQLGVAVARHLLLGSLKPVGLNFLSNQRHFLPVVSVATGRNLSSDSLPPYQILSMPALSPTMNKGNVIRWKKKEGEEVAAGDVLCEIETDKASVDFETLEEGFLAKILVPAGAKEVSVGRPLCIVVENAKDIQAMARWTILNAVAKDVPSEHPYSVEDKSSRTFSTSFDKIGPSVRRLLAESGLEKSMLQGTGPRGQLVKGDVLAALRSGGNQEPTNAGGSRAIRAPPAWCSSVHRPSLSDLDGLFDHVPTSQIRKIIAKRLLDSKNGIPHLYLSTDAVLDPMLAIRKQLMDQHGIKLSVNDFVIRAAALALKAVPEANAFWDESAREAVSSSSIDIAVAVSTDKGLMTPILRHADQKSLAVISSEVRLLADKARMGKLAPHEFQGGTFSISNLGMYSVSRFCAIINPPQACILAVGRGEKAVIWEETIPGSGKPMTVTNMSMTISADPRVFDADIGGRFLQSLSANFSDPRKMML